MRLNGSNLGNSMNSRQSAVRPRYKLTLPDSKPNGSKPPLKEVLIRLPLLAVSPSGQIDWLRRSPSLLLELAEHADAGMAGLSLAISAVGILIAFAAVSDEESGAGAAIGSVGSLIGDLGVVMGYCQTLAAECRQAKSTRED